MVHEASSPSSEPMRKGFKHSGMEEVAAAAKAAADIMREIRNLVTELVEQAMKALDGAKLGREVGEFYKNLIENGMPEEMARQLTMEFFKQRLEAAPKLSSLIEALAKEISGPAKNPKLAEKIVVIKGGEKDEKKVIVKGGEESEEDGGGGKEE